MEIEIEFTQNQTDFVMCQERNAKYIGGIGSGKSFVLTFWAMTQASMGRVVLYLLPTYRMISDIAMPTLKEHLLNCGIDGRTTKQPPTFVHPSGGMILFRSAESGDTLRGINAHDLCIDEAGFITEEVFLIALGRVRKSSDGKIRMVGTPTGEGHWFSDLKAVTFRQSTLSNPFIPIEYKRDLVERYGGLGSSWAKQEILGEIIALSAHDAIVLKHWLDVAINRHQIESYGKPIVLGVDVARFGNDDNSAHILKNNTLQHLENKPSGDTDDISNWIESLWAEHNPNVIVIDMTNMQGIYDMVCKRLSHCCRIIGYIGSEAPQDYHYANSRAECWGRMADAIRDYVKLIDNPEWINLIKIKYKFAVGSNRKLIMSKDDIKGILGKSPNELDSASLCFHPLIPKEITKKINIYDYMEA